MKQTTIIIKPVITEKSLSDAQKGIFTFVVSKEAAKPRIKKEIEDLFKVHVVRISTSVRKGKTKRVGKLRREVRRPSVKIAFVQLKESEKIDFFEVQTK